LEKCKKVWGNALRFLRDAREWIKNFLELEVFYQERN
jgi:hypothetical protein